MTADPRWLEILKASGGQTAAVAVGLGLTYGLIQQGWLPSPGQFWLVAIAGGAIVCACLALVSLLTWVARQLPFARWVRKWMTDRAVSRSVQAYIPYMSEPDRLIIGYLLHHRQKSFTGDMDGGNAASLISRGIVVCTVRPGQAFSPSDMPFAIPDLVWDELERAREKFPYIETDGLPWRVDWRLR